MLLIPAIDLKDGQCVRLQQGDMTKVTTFNTDPVEQALHWLDQGARRLHLVDLNGAFAGKPKNLGVVKEILQELGSEQLQTLPPQAVLDKYRWESRIVTRDGMVSFDGVRYGVP